MKTKEESDLRKQYPWYVRPREGCIHEVVFGNQYAQRGTVPGMPVGVSLNCSGDSLYLFISIAIDNRKHVMIVCHNGMIFDVRDGNLSFRKAELWDSDSTSATP